MSAALERVEVVRRSARVERWRAGAPRVLLIATLAITSLVGVHELVSPSEPEAGASASAGTDHALEEFAQGFARAYLSYDSARPDLRERALARYGADALDSGAGLTPPARGAQEVTTTQITQNQEALAGGRIVVVAARFADDREPVYLAVPVSRLEGGAIALAGYPSLVGPPASASAELPDREEISAPDVVEVSERVVGNYLAGERSDLAADLAPEASVSLPAQRLEVTSVEEVVWADGPDSGAVLATVIAADEGGTTWTLTYELGVERRAGRVLVSFIETLANET
ncbi:MAG: conjugal transfer protein [Candidatus Limnocylindria bacterium]